MHTLKSLLVITVLSFIVLSCTEQHSKDEEVEKADSTATQQWEGRTIVIDDSVYRIVDSFVVINDEGGVDMYYTYE